MLSVEELSEVGKELSASVSGSWEGPGGLPSQAGAKPWFTGSYSCAPWSSFSAQRSRLMSLQVSVCGSCPGACTTASWQFIRLTLSPPRLGVAERKMGFIQPCVPHRLVSSLSSESRFKKNVFH